MEMDDGDWKEMRAETLEADKFTCESLTSQAVSLSKEIDRARAAAGAWNHQTTEAIKSLFEEDLAQLDVGGVLEEAIQMYYEYAKLKLGIASSIPRDVKKELMDRAESIFSIAGAGVAVSQSQSMDPSCADAELLIEEE